MNQVIVVGGGLSGHAAAHTALERGARVLLLDKSKFCGGNSTKATSGMNASGTSSQRALGLQDSPEIFYEDTLKSAAERARPELIKTLTYESGPALEWLKESFKLDLSVIARMAAASVPRCHRSDTGKFPGMEITYTLMEAYEEACAKTPEKARLINSARVVELIQDKTTGEVSGVIYEKDGQRYQENGVVILATGGFGADFSDDSLLSKVSEEFAKMEAWSTTSRAAQQGGGKKIPMPNLLSLPTTNGPHCTGDGIKLANAAGSDNFDLHCVQIHPTGIVDPSEPNAKVKFLAAEALRGSGGLILDRDGKRFCDELGKRDYVSGRMLLHGKPPYRLCLNSKATSLISWHCEHYSARGLMKKMSGAELAKACNTSQSELQKEFDVYNKAALNPDDKTLNKWDKKFFEATPVMADDVFHVAEITPLIHYCMGGISCNGDAQVTDINGRPIPGLMGCGELLGGIHGANRLGGSSLLDCVVYGRVAGRTSSTYLMDKLLSGGATAGTDGIDIKVKPGEVTISFGKSGSSAPAAAAGPAAPAAEAPKAAAAEKKVVTAAELAAHKTKDDCWVAIHGNVYNVSSFLNDHPGGPKAILLYAGKDATEPFDMLHKKEVLAKYISDLEIGPFQENSKL